MRVSVIIPHLRGTATLLPLLEDLRGEQLAMEQQGRLEVILVDNASEDGSAEMAAERHPWIRVHRLAKNEGYAGGCNRGIEVSEGEWVWLLNDDVRLQPGVVSGMLEQTRDDEVAAVQPKVRSLVHPELFDYAGAAGGMMDIYGYPFALGRIGGHLERDEGQYDNPRDIFWASGTACLWRRATLDQIGLLDERFFAHMEEIDLSWRAWNTGWRVVSAPAATVQHLGGGTLRYQAWRKMFLNHRNGLMSLAKNRQARTLIWLFPVRLLMDNGIGLAEAVLGRPGRITAVWAGWLAFLWNSPHWLSERRAAQRLRSRADRELHHIHYRGSILFAYLSGVRSASGLVAPPGADS